MRSEVEQRAGHRGNGLLAEPWLLLLATLLVIPLQFVLQFTCNLKPKGRPYQILLGDVYSSVG